MYNDSLKQLIAIGLSDKEARVYIAVLELGPSSVQEIALKSDVNRATTYLMLDTLKERGLVSSYDDAKRTVFVAETPKKLVELVEREARNLDEKREKVVIFVPELEAMYRTQRNKPVVRFYEGEEGLRSLRDYLTRIVTTQFDTFARLNASLGQVAQHDEERRLGILRHDTRYRMLYAASPGVEIPRFPSDAMKQIEIRFASAIPFHFDGEIGIIDEAAYLVSTSPKAMATIMESAQIATLMRAQFELAWSCASTERVDMSGL
ncbi:MAG TPA: helix-turn-helix domain-containing protein [Candidatus Methylomirabilis sp.]|nr:helix-turn-helix domain-containing protein [Candidatus Methylomirabilis sp.]